MSHTAGPWYTSGEAGDAFDISTELPDENGECEHVIATVWANRPSLPDAADDARLIAAAPEMLAALRELVHYDEGSSERGSYGYEVLRRCKAVIAKAKGRE
jgi:hypothetical protein